MSVVFVAADPTLALLIFGDAIYSLLHTSKATRTALHQYELHFINTRDNTDMVQSLESTGEVRNGGRLTSPLWKGSSPEGLERPRRRHYLVDLQRERKKR